MAVETTPDLSRLFVDKERMRRIIEEQNALLGFVPDPTATAEKVRAMMLAEGIDPNSNEFSRGIIEMREE